MPFYVIARRNDETIQYCCFLDCFVPRSNAKRVYAIKAASAME